MFKNLNSLEMFTLIVALDEYTSMMAHVLSDHLPEPSFGKESYERAIGMKFVLQKEMNKKMKEEEKTSNEVW